jgi:hypothetical protein
MLLIFNVVLGAKPPSQAFAVVAHAEVLNALHQLFILPLNYVRETLASATTLAVFLPMVHRPAFARFLG